MKRSLVAALAALAVTAVPVSFAQKADSMRQGGGSPMMESMMQGMDMQKMKSMHMSGDTDKDFATMMRMHHQNGLRMAEAELKQGKDPEMKEMARKIAETQRQEIREFDDWLAKKK